MEFSTGLCIGVSVTPGVASTPTKSLAPPERSLDLLPGHFYTSGLGLRGVNQVLILARWELRRQTGSLL